MEDGLRFEAVLEGSPSMIDGLVYGLAEDLGCNAISMPGAPATDDFKGRWLSGPDKVEFGRIRLHGLPDDRTMLIALSANASVDPTESPFMVFWENLVEEISRLGFLREPGSKGAVGFRRPARKRLIGL